MQRSKWLSFSKMGDISGHFSFTIWTILAVKSYIFYHREARFISMDRPASYCLPYFHHWKDQNLLIIPNHETITCYQSTSLPLECSKLMFLERSTSLLGNSKLWIFVPIWNVVTTLNSYQCFHNDRVAMFQMRQDCGERGLGTNVCERQYQMRTRFSRHQLHWSISHWKLSCLSKCLLPL